MSTRTISKKCSVLTLVFLFALLVHYRDFQCTAEPSIGGAGVLEVARTANISSSDADTAPAAANTDSTASGLVSCLRDVLNELPIGKGLRPAKFNPKNIDVVYAHHYNANNGKLWNADMRLENLPLLEQEGCSVWEVGAHETGADTKNLLKRYPKCQYHAFEPVPKFYAKLKKAWQNKRPKVQTHNFGLGKEARSLNVSESALKGQSTYLGGNSSSSEAGKRVHIRIKTFDQALNVTGGYYPTLLHMNCEGCEWDLLPELVETGFLAHVPLLQVGTHNYGKDLGARVFELCQIRQMISTTHQISNNSIAFSWERWERRRQEE